MQRFDKPGYLRYYGTEAAELFTREVEESLNGVLTKNMIADPDNPMQGFVSASVDGRPWTDTMWTRDAGVFLRELVQWGYLDHARLLVQNLLELVQKNDEGFHAFPERFELGKPGSGGELDGTSAIIIGMVLLRERLDDRDPTGRRIDSFLDAPDSPLAYMSACLQKRPLLAGTGEFGGGCGIHGEHANAVQNNLARLSLLSAAGLARRKGLSAQARDYEEYAAKIAANMLKYMRDTDGSWLWCVNAETMKPEEEVLTHIINKGTGSINGVFAMQADVLGFDPSRYAWEGIEAGRRTFDRLYEFPLRRSMFRQYGLWTQSDEFCRGLMTGPSYGHGYATQEMLLDDRAEMAERAIRALAEVTYRPFGANRLDRESPYWFYERIYLPELLQYEGDMRDGAFHVFDGKEFDQGCGALNLVCVAEPLKIARLIAGVDDSSPGELRLIPRLPASWSGFEAKDWPVLTANGMTSVSIRCRRKQGVLQVEFDELQGTAIPSLALRLPDGDGYRWRRYRDVRSLNASSGQ